jgi:hypothetical protein
VSYLKRINPKLSSIDNAIKSRPTANGVLKQAGVDKNILKGDRPN